MYFYLLQARNLFFYFYPYLFMWSVPVWRARFRLSALVVFYIHLLKRIFLLSRQNSLLYIQFLRTHSFSISLLYINYQTCDPHLRIFLSFLPPLHPSPSHSLSHPRRRPPPSLSALGAAPARRGPQPAQLPAARCSVRGGARRPCAGRTARRVRRACAGERAELEVVEGRRSMRSGGR